MSLRQTEIGAAAGGGCGMKNIFSSVFRWELLEHVCVAGDSGAGAK